MRRHAARPHVVVADFFRDRGGELARMHGLGAAGAASIRSAAANSGFFKQMPDGMRLTARVVEVAAEIVAAREPFEAVQLAEQPRRELEAAFGELDRRREDVGPRQAAVLAMRELEHAQRARHADGETADADVRERFRAGRSRRGTCRASLPQVPSRGLRMP